jgi:type I restriction enzyme, R subunit
VWNRLERQLAIINPKAETAAIEEAIRKLRAFSLPSLIQTNRDLQKWILDGIDVQFRNKKGEIKSDNIQLVDFENKENNDLLAVNQLTYRVGGGLPATVPSHHWTYGPVSSGW